MCDAFNPKRQQQRKHRCDKNKHKIDHLKVGQSGFNLNSNLYKPNAPAFSGWPDFTDRIISRIVFIKGIQPSVRPPVFKLKNPQHFSVVRKPMVNAKLSDVKKRKKDVKLITAINLLKWFGTIGSV